MAEESHPLDPAPDSPAPAARRSRYDTFRRRVAPVAFLIALVVLAMRTCEADAAQVELRFDLGPAATRVRAFRVDVFPSGESQGVAHFDRRYGAAGAPAAPTFELQLDPGSYALAFTIALADAGERRFTRAVEVRDQARITVPIAGELMPAP